MLLKLGSKITENLFQQHRRAPKKTSENLREGYGHNQNDDTRQFSKKSQRYGSL